MGVKPFGSLSNGAVVSVVRRLVFESLDVGVAVVLQVSMQCIELEL